MSSLSEVSGKAAGAFEQTKAAFEFISFVNDSPTPFHAVKSARKRLAKAGFKEIRERDSWSSTCQPGGKYYLTRNGSTIVAFAIGKKWKPGNPIAMVGAHTDSPCLRIKPVSKKQSEGFLQVGVETYGGGLWHTWFDRDLGIAGRAMVKQKDGSISQRLVKIDRPILRIPTLAIHLDRQETFTFNKETQLFPIAGLLAAELKRLDGIASSKEAPESAATVKPTDPQNPSTKAPFHPLKAMTMRHHPYIVELIASEAGVEPENIIDFELVLFDTQKACLGGLLNEFIFSARLDNLNMSFCAVQGLIASLKSDSALENDSTIRLISLFDHEEIGSLTAQGADSNMLPSVIRRLSVIPPASSSPRTSMSLSSDSSERSYDKTASTIHSDAPDLSTTYEQTLSSSFLLSADMAHSVNPNYAHKYENDHKPEMNKGPVIKVNANARYATNSPGIALLQEIAKRAVSTAQTHHSSSASTTSNPSKSKTDDTDDSNAVGVPLQLFVVRNDSSCGGTIGPMLSAALGARTLDLGNAQLSMHSIRETGGTQDVHYAIRLFSSFFEHYGTLESKILVD